MADRGSDWAWLPSNAASSPGSYCNNVQLSVSLWDFTFEFSQLTPMAEQAEDGSAPVAKNVIDRVVMSPQHAKAFSQVLQQNVEEWERQFGEIPTAPQPDER